MARARRNTPEPGDQRIRAASEREDPPPSTALTASDWVSIRAACEAARHAVVPCDNGHSARNPGQRWLAHFDGRGFSVTPDAGGWSWGLELLSYGFRGAERAVDGEARVQVHGAHVAYAWDATLEEWYENDGRGLEHGYTVQERPEGDGPLTLMLAVRGELRAEPQADGRGVRFLNAAGAAVIHYAELHVFDAEGRDLPARFEREAKGLRMIVEEESARYPLTIDPIAQQAYLKASNPGQEDQFGYAVSVSGDTAVIGAHGEDSGSTGVKGDENNNDAGLSGAAYLFARNGSLWSQEAYVKASNSEAGDAFGLHVALWGDTAVVSAILEDSAATGVNGDETNDDANASGAAYVFARSGSVWSQEAYLKAANTGANDQFGRAVSLSDDRLAIGACFEDSADTGTEGDGSDEDALDSGATYLFTRRGSTWSPEAYLEASNTGASDFFGWSVSLSGSALVVGAQFEDSGAGGVNGDESSNALPNAGAAYAFELDPSDVGTPLCFGDGSGARCACGNEATPGSGGGCANASPMPAGQGAVLSASGTNGIAADELVLTADFTTNQPGLFFQGNNAIGGGTGITFGDGIRCCGGSVVRLEVVDPPGTAGPKTASTTQAILGTSPSGTTTPGDTRCYQWWYRNPGTSSCGSNFNVRTRCS